MAGGDAEGVKYTKRLQEFPGCADVQNEKTGYVLDA